MAATLTGPAKSRAAKAPGKKKAAKATAGDYNTFKQFGGKTYTGMQIGRSHKWYYDKGEWKERKVGPDQWEISYAVTKRRAGQAPEGSGVPVGTGYHWFILSHQFVHKLNEDDYSTAMTGIKLKVAHKRAGKDNWNLSEKAKREHLLKMLKDFISQLESEPQMTEIVPLEFDYRGKHYKGTGVPLPTSCTGGVCRNLDVTLNGDHLGMLRCTEKGWRLTGIRQGLTNAIGNEVFLWYE